MYNSITKQQLKVNLMLYRNKQTTEDNIHKTHTDHFITNSFAILDQLHQKLIHVYKYYF